MQVLVMFSQCRAFVYAQSLKCKPRFCLKKPIPFSPDSNGAVICESAAISTILTTLMIHGCYCCHCNDLRSGLQKIMLLLICESAAIIGGLPSIASIANP